MNSTVDCGQKISSDVKDDALLQRKQKIYLQIRELVNNRWDENHIGEGMQNSYVEAPSFIAPTP